MVVLAVLVLFVVWCLAWGVLVLAHGGNFWDGVLFGAAFAVTASALSGAVWCVAWACRTLAEACR